MQKAGERRWNIRTQRMADLPETSIFKLPHADGQKTAGGHEPAAAAASVDDGGVGADSGGGGGSTRSSSDGSGAPFDQPVVDPAVLKIMEEERRGSAATASPASRKKR